MSSAAEEVFLDDVLVKHAGRLQRQTALSIRTDLHPTYVVGDPAALNEAVASLVDHALSNAVSAIDLAVCRHGAEAIITVGDDGPCAAAEVLAERQRGLDRVARIVSGHGGTLTISDRAPCGTSVTARLPSTRQRHIRPLDDATSAG
ncbi:hypothetical protein P3H80_00405 [Mycolicibacterium septicum]|uniref:ATP-binding protein n=1 Tax=Mycolicibacterium septicum TaxID=98668 RepID=UPI0023E19C82|nr:ATP-binding protein [Mycolicibacterium septicum]MDF3335858.1 hypothetical protein [Mycolicibacterium septicum]